MGLLDSAGLSSPPQHHMRGEGRSGPWRWCWEEKGLPKSLSTLPPPAARPLKRKLRNTPVLGGRNLGEVRAGAGFCKPKFPINPFQALKSVPPPSGTMRLRSWSGRAHRAPLTQINYRGWIRCTRARQTWPKLGQDNAGTSERTGRSAGEWCWGVWSWPVLSMEHGRVKQHSSWSREGWGSCRDWGSCLSTCSFVGFTEAEACHCLGHGYLERAAERVKSCLPKDFQWWLDFQHQGSLDCLTSSNFLDTICSFMSFISALRPFFIDIFQTSAI